MAQYLVRLPAPLAAQHLRQHLRVKRGGRPLVATGRAAHDHLDWWGQVQLQRIGGTLAGSSRWRIDPVHVQPQVLVGNLSAEQSIGGPAP